MVSWVSLNQGIMWNMRPCSSSLSPPVTPQHDSLKQGLYLLLCDQNSTIYILSKARGEGWLGTHIWLLAGLDRSLVSALPQFYVPIDSTVAEVKFATIDVFHIHELWSPGHKIGLKQSHLATWRACPMSRKVILEAGDQGEWAEQEPETTGGGSASTSTPDLEEVDHTEWIEQQEPGTTARRLVWSSIPKYERRRDLSGVHFIVTSINDSRAHRTRYSLDLGRDVFSGFFGDVWELLKDEMNFTYSVITPADGEFGSYTGGLWTGLVKDVLSKRAHVVVAHLSQTYSRAQVLDFSSVLIKLSYRIFARPPELSAVSWTSYTRPFSSALWLCLLLVLALLAIVFWGVSHCYFHKLSTNPTRGSRKEAMKYQEWKREFLLLTWAAITQQGWPNSPDAGVLRILFWMMYVIGLVVMAAYSATLVSFLTVVNDQLPFDTLEDLKQLQKYRLGIQKGSMLEEFFKNQNFLVYYKALIEPYTDTLKKSIIELRTLALKNSDYAYVGSYEVQRLDSVGACIFKSAHRHLLFNDGALAWPQGSPYLQLFDHFINKYRESGILQKLKNVWYPRPYSCSNQPVVALGFQQVFTAFVLLSLGVGFSVLLLSLEKLVIKCISQMTKIQVKRKYSSFCEHM
ncbi:probable glutamate receptor isoform X3 [Cherax quadricarinatus]